MSDNEITWAKHKTKLGDPVKNLAEAIDTAVLSAFNSTINTGADQENALAGSLAFTASELTIAAGSITPTRSSHTVDTAGDASSDDLDTMNTASVSDGAIVILHAENAGRTVVVKHGTGNIDLFGDTDYNLDDLTKNIVLQRRGATWYELSPRSRVNQVYFEDGAVATGTTITPLDDTIPQNTEGTEFMTASITASSASAVLLAEVEAVVSVNVSIASITMALFQDSTADALAVTADVVTSGDMRTLTLRHRFASGVAGSTTLKIRIGAQVAGTVTFNGTAGARLFGGTSASNITITESAS